MPMTDNQVNAFGRAKKSSREDRIAAELRRRIVAGILQPGMRLPTRVELRKEFDSANQTVQRSVSRLIRDGFLVPRGRLGTFVSDKPSYLHRYGVAFSMDPTDPGLREEVKFQTFLYREVLAMQNAHKLDIVPYLNVNGNPGSEGFQRLLDDVRNERLAGVMFDTPINLNKPHLSALLDGSQMPFVAISHGTSHANLSAVSLNGSQLMERALDLLLEHNRRRVAFFLGLYNSQLITHFEREIARRQMITRPYWIQSTSPKNIKSARNCAHLLMEAGDAPDALIIADDSIVEHTTEGLVDAGVRVPDDLEVVAHCNFPTVTPSLVPAKRIGFDVRQILNTCLNVIDRRRRHEDVPSVTEVQPLFDDEVGARLPVSVPGYIQEEKRQGDVRELVGAS
jgi:DNA-binding LacI/PurR family transcriptional regulator